jgi:hypothetical protein
MKKFIFFEKLILTVLAMCLSSIFIKVFAQSGTITIPPPAKNYISYDTKVSLLILGAGIMSTANHTGNMNISFPYQTIDANGTSTSHVFKGSNGHLFSKQSPEIFFGVDVTRPYYTTNFSAGFNTSYKGAFYSIGSGFNLYLGHWESSLSEKTKKCTWTLRSSLNVTYFSFSSGTIGTIPNINTTINVLGSEAKPTFTYTNYSSSSSHKGFSSYTANADKLIVSYKQNQLGLQPKIAICTNPYKAKYSIQLFASYFIPLYQSGGIILRQHNDTYGKTHLVSGSNTNTLNNQTGITATYNNHSFHSVPFRANNIFIGVVFGFTIQ